MGQFLTLKSRNRMRVDGGLRAYHTTRDALTTIEEAEIAIQTNWSGLQAWERFNP